MSGEVLKVLVVDDEEPARRLLAEYVARIEGFEVVALAGNGFDAVKAVADHRPDVLLLDVQMPKLDGFEVLELLEDPPAVVFVTAFDEHAIRAFDVHAVDYLLKPCSRDRLREALLRARERVGTGQPPPDLSRTARRGPYLTRILIRDGAKVHVVPIADVDYLEASDDTVVVHIGGARLTKAARLSAFVEDLDPSQFVRIHRSYILNLDRLDRIELYAKDSRIAILDSGDRLPLSRAGYALLRDRL